MINLRLNRLNRSFFNRSPLVVAPNILGKILVRKIGNEIISGRIVEVEAYLGSLDSASHSFKGKTNRNKSLFLSAGHIYIHSIHRQNCLDIVTQKEGEPTSVLIRALEPLMGIEIMKKKRNKSRLEDLTSGPGKLTQALSINKSHDGIDLTLSSSELYVCEDRQDQLDIKTSTRIGISKEKEKQYRFYLPKRKYLSR